NQPALFRFKRRSTIADLDKFPRAFRFGNQMDFIVPIGNRIRKRHIAIFTIHPTEHNVFAIDLPWKKSSTFIGDLTIDRLHFEIGKILGGEQFWKNRMTIISRIGSIIGYIAFFAFIGYKTGIFNSILLGIADRKDYSF